MITPDTKFFGLLCVLMLAVFWGNRSPGTVAAAEALKVIFGGDGRRSSLPSHLWVRLDCVKNRVDV